MNRYMLEIEYIIWKINNLTRSVTGKNSEICKNNALLFLSNKIKTLTYLEKRIKKLLSYLEYTKKTAIKNYNMEVKSNKFVYK